MWYFESINWLSGIYSIVGVFFFIFFLSGLFMTLAYLVSQKCRYESDKMTSFECGFDPLSSSRLPFSLRFFLLALLFLVFDLEMILFFPFIISVANCYLKMSALSKVWVFLFLVVLVLGLMHELNEGTIDWEMDD
uniref:NADH dehydrogenase subunit 3 n=1 Tax=Marcia hiantina TaxID=676960 RepID=UPI002238DA71|nr:NADH dehydrogenase subunit 3 [Marcia hiantina]UYR95089.1 NADH dehydrogenase subunit 3 [Marcia hiantina]